jgi:RNA polymerase sigma factor (sigma-70 family)
MVKQKNNFKKSSKNSKPKASSKKAVVPKAALKSKKTKATIKVRAPKMTAAQKIEKLIIENRVSAQKMGYSILKRWNVHIEKEELNSVIDYALCDAAMRYIPNKGASFLTYFYYHLRGHLVRLVAELTMENSMFIKPETNTTLDYDNDLVNKYYLESIVYNKSDLIDSPESTVIREEELNNCSSSMNRLDKLEQEVLTRIYNNESLVKVARSLGYSRCHISRIKKESLLKLKAIYSFNATFGKNSKIVPLDIFRKVKKARNKSKTLIIEAKQLAG